MDVANGESPFNLNLKLLQAFGFWRPNVISNAYRFYAACMIGLFNVVFVTTEIANIILVFGELEQMTDASFLLLTHLAECPKIYCFLKHHDRLRNLMTKAEYPSVNLKNLTQISMMEAAAKKYRMFFRFYLTMSLATCALWAVFPLVERGAEIKLPLGAWYPFSVERSPMLEIIYLYQIAGAAVNAGLNVSMDVFIAGIMCHIAGQLDVLNDSLERIGRKDARTKNLKPKKALLVCVRHHNDILNMAREFGALFSISLFSQFVASSIIICLTMFKLTLVSLRSLEFLSMVLYQACMLLEIVLYCWFGNEIKLKSSQLSTSAYNSEWTDCPASYKHDLLFIMTRTVVPIQLHAGSFFALSLETFLAVLKTSWSYFAVIRSVHGDE